MNPAAPEPSLGAFPTFTTVSDGPSNRVAAPHTDASANQPSTRERSVPVTSIRAPRDGDTRTDCDFDDNWSKGGSDGLVLVPAAAAAHSTVTSWHLRRCE